ncbi:MAG: hypothetical protein WCY30_02340 [Candidatus Neomarinimicrobiota bacterium]
MKINGIKIKAKEFAYDECHKIYLIDLLAEKKDAIGFGYIIYPIEKLPDIWERACPLRFIRRWRGCKPIVRQGEKAVFSEIKLVGD